MEHWKYRLAWLLIVLVTPAVSFAQSRPGSAFVYEVAFGGGGRTTSGRVSTPPSGASSPTFGGANGTVSVHGGIQLRSRLAFVGVWDVIAGGSSGPGKWGSMGMYGVARLGLTRRIWIEGGGGSAMLAYGPPPQISVRGTHYWSRAIEAGGGIDIFRADKVAVGALGRYSSTNFHGLMVNSFSVQLAFRGWR